MRLIALLSLLSFSLVIHAAPSWLPFGQSPEGCNVFRHATVEKVTLDKDQYLRMTFRTECKTPQAEIIEGKTYRYFTNEMRVFLSCGEEEWWPEWHRYFDQTGRELWTGPHSVKGIPVTGPQQAENAIIGTPIRDDSPMGEVLNQYCP
jgi:hypothetical protein